MTALWTLPDNMDTPALVVDVDVLSTNLAFMNSALDRLGVDLRPHIKTHKCVEIARMQLRSGAVGLTVSSLGEAEVFADHGFEDMFIAYPLFISPPKAARLRDLCERAHIRVGVDSEEGAAAISMAQSGADVLIEIDSGQHRSGVRPDDAGDLARTCLRAHLNVVGMFTHAGHSYRPGSPTGAANDELSSLERAVASFEQVGVPANVVSAGSTPTALSSARDPVTEERPGTYVFYDRQQIVLGTAKRDQVALAVAATIVSTAVPGQAVIDAGSKSLAGDRPEWLQGFGIVPEFNDAPVETISECHGIIKLDDHHKPFVGQVVQVVPNHVCTVVNLFDHYLVVSQGEVVDRWPVTARGHQS
jgi:D-serine deaminase-like pyridoxal phosphate-dependent protein